MGKAKPFLDRKNVTMYRLVHPTERAEDEEAAAAGGEGDGKRVAAPVFQKVGGDVDYFSEEEEEYPYREDSGDEGEFGDEPRKEVNDDGEDRFDDVEEGEDGDEFAAEGSAAGSGGDAMNRKSWIRSKEETMSEYSSWSSRTASSYLPPARRRQWRCSR